MDTTKVRTKFKAKEQARREERVEFANVQAARAEVAVGEEENDKNESKHDQSRC